MFQLKEILKMVAEYERELPPPLAPLPMPVGREIAGWIDHTLLKPQATIAQIRLLCQEAREYQFATVCINPVYVPLAASILAGSDVRVCAVVGFPLGATTSTQKMFETLNCISNGANEVDMVLHVGGLQGTDYEAVYNDIILVTQAAHSHRSIVKVIFETCLLTRNEKIMACVLCREAGVDYVKTSTGFSTGGATVEDVDLMVRLVGPKIKVKAAGGIRTLADAQAMIRAGASRLGASAGVQIIKEAIA
jgi:deoxyribose-phosphate aldolase